MSEPLEPQGIEQPAGDLTDPEPTGIVSTPSHPPPGPQGVPPGVEAATRERLRWWALGVVVVLVGVVVVAAMALGGDDNDERAARRVSVSALAIEEGNWEDAVAAATEAIELEPSDEILATALVNRGVAYGQLGCLECSADDATSALALEPPSEVAARALVLRSNASNGDGRFDEAVADATTAIDLEPDDRDILAWAYTSRGGAFNELGRTEDAIADTTIAIGLGPDNSTVLVQALINRCAAYRGVGRFDDAVADATTAIELGPDDVNLLAASYLFRAYAYDEMDQLADAIADATSAIDLEPDSQVLVALYLFRGEAFAELGQLNDAAADLDAVISANPYAEASVQELRDRYAIAAPAVDHHEELDPAETPLIARHLVAVEGYTYVDAIEREVDSYLAYIDDDESSAGIDFIVGASWHSVVADDRSQNTVNDVEVGFLQLYQFSESNPDGLREDYLRERQIPGDQIAELEIAGVSVRLFEHPPLEDSRYWYTWSVADVTGVFDGADREPLERWLTAYLEGVASDEH